MKQKFDAIILGRGMAGLGTAVGLARRGKKVLVLERKNLLGRSSPAAAGILDPLLEMKPGSPLLRFSFEAFRGYPAWVRLLKKKTGVDSGFKRFGMTYAAQSPEEEREIKKRFEWQKKSGLPVIWLTRRELLKKEPVLSARVRCGILYPTIARVFPADLVRALESYGRRLGVTFREGKNPEIIFKENKIRGVRMGGHFFEAPFVVQASGSWAGLKGLKSARLPVVPARGEILILRAGKEKVRSIIHSMNGGYVVPWKRGEYLAGSTVEFAGFKPEVTRRGLQSIRQKIKNLAPAIGDLKTLRSWAGLRPFPKDRMPLIGPTRIRGLYAAAGFYRSGILIGMHAGDLLAKGMISGRMPPALGPFDPRRFES